MPYVLRKRPILVLFSVLAFCFPFMISAGNGTFDQTVTVEIGIMPLLLGIGIIMAALVIEWNGIVNLFTLEHQSLYAIEMKHPKLPRKREIVIVILLSLALTIFLTQVVLRSYDAMPLYPSDFSDSFGN